MEGFCPDHLHAATFLSLPAWSAPARAEGCRFQHHTFFSPAFFTFSQPKYPLFFPISINKALTKTLTYANTLREHTLNAAARFMNYPKLWNVVCGKRKGVGGKCAFCWGKVKNAGGKIFMFPAVTTITQLQLGPGLAGPGRAWQDRTSGCVLFCQCSRVATALHYISEPGAR